MYVIGIAGGTGSGKTTLVNQLLEALPSDSQVGHLSQDDYYKDLSHLTLQEREQVNFDHPDSLELSLMVEHIKALRKGQPVVVPTYSFAQHNRSEGTRKLEPPQVLIVEGILVQSDEALAAAMDLKIYVHTPSHIRMERRVARDQKDRGRTHEEIVNRFVTTITPMHKKFIAPCRETAHLIVHMEQPNPAAVDFIIRGLQSHLQDA